LCVGSGLRCYGRDRPPPGLDCVVILNVLPLSPPGLLVFHDDTCKKNEQSMKRYERCFFSYYVQDFNISRDVEVKVGSPRLRDRQPFYGI